MEFEFEMAMDMDMMSQEQLMHIISQLDSALASSPSPSTSPSASPPHQPPAPAPPVPPPCLLGATMAPPAMYPAAATPVQSSRGSMVYTTTTRQADATAEEDQDAAPRPRRRNAARVSSEPQSVAARLRRERVSQRMRALQRLVPGSARLDTASMLEEAIHYVRFLKGHVQSLERAAAALHVHGARGRRDLAAVAGDDDDIHSRPPYYA